MYKVMETEMKEFANLMQPFGYLDLRTSLNILEELRTEDENQFKSYFDNCLALSDALHWLLEERAENLEMKIADLDPVGEVLDYILQMNRNKIDEVIAFDFQNDGEQNINTYYNFMGSSYDYSEEAKAELKGKINEATDEEKIELKDDIFVSYFLREIEIEVK